jgi:PGF-CTERM protein
MIAAVFAAFLVLALFAGAGAAANSWVAGNPSSAYIYQYGGIYTNNDTIYYLGTSAPSSTSVVKATYTLDAGPAAGQKTLNDPTALDGYYVDDPTNGQYFYLSHPTLSLNLYLAGTGTSVAGTTLTAAQSLDFKVTNGTALKYGLEFTTPAGGQTSDFNASSYADSEDSGFAANMSSVKLDTTTVGTWSVIAKYNTTGPLNVSIYTPDKYLKSSSVTFTVGDSSSALTVSKDKIIRGNSVLLTLSGIPGTPVNVSVDANGFNLLAGQSDIDYTQTLYSSGWISKFNVTIPATGKVVVQLNTNESTKAQSYKFTGKFYGATATTEKTAKVTVEKGVITIAPDQDSYYIGTELTFSGTNTESKNVYLYIKGSNKALQQVNDTNGDRVTVTVKSDNTWTQSFKLANAFDAGTYTVYAVTSDLGAFPASLDGKVYESCSVALKQPFLTATAASSTVAKGDDIKITGTAEAADSLLYYVFGTNKFVTGFISPEDDGSYSQKISTDNLDAGQYFVVIQHPMYDKVFNVKPINGIIYQNNSGEATSASTELFNTAERQSANAAEALCQAIDTQNIDDIYVKLTFIVATPTLTMNPVSDVTKGSALKVSGTTNLKADTLVTVDVLSTAFTAVDKSSVNSASFITLTTKVVAGADGVNTWEVTFDTTGLNVDSYTIQATTDDLSTSTVIKITEAKPTSTATATATKTATATATATATPTKTPGFGAFLALAGLGAVAVLVLRRD